VLRVLEASEPADEADVESIVDELAAAGHAIVAREHVQDAKAVIREQLTAWIGDRGIDVVIAIGGTDETPTDPMLDALAPLVSRQFFGFGELFRAIVHQERGTASIFSHAEAALCGSTVVILLPAAGFVPAACEQLLLPQLDYRTRPRNLAMSLPRLQAVPNAIADAMSGRVPPPRTRTGAVPMVIAPQRETTSRVAVVPPTPPAKARTSTQIPTSMLREPARPVTPQSVPIQKLEARDDDEEVAAPVNAFADALKEAAQVRRTQSIAAQLPTAPEPIPELPPVVAPPADPVPTRTALAAKIEAARSAEERASKEFATVDLAAMEETTDKPAAPLPESTSGTIDMDALVTSAETVKPAPRVTAPPPFVPRTTTSIKAVTPDELERPKRKPTPPPPTDAEVAALAQKPGKEPIEPRMFVDPTARSFGRAASRGGAPLVEGRRRKTHPAVVVLLIAAGLSVVVAATVVTLSMMRSHDAVAEPKRDVVKPQIAMDNLPDAAVPMQDPAPADAAEIEMPPMVDTPVDAAAPIALVSPPPSRPVPVHDPAPVTIDAGEAPAPVQDGCDEVSCVLEHYQNACCAKFKPKDPEPAIAKPDGPPEKLERTMVAPAVERVKPAVIACGERANAPKGIVKVQVHVKPDGSVSFVTVAEAPDALLGDCVAAAMQKAVFPTTQTGGGFTYPFSF